MQLFVDNLTNVDFSYLDPQRGLVGETWLASITLEGALDEQGMVCDFGIIKKTVRQWLDTYIDHCLIVGTDNQRLQYNETSGNITVQWPYAEDKQIHCTSPAEAITLIPSAFITPSSVSIWCVEQLRALLPDTIDKIHLRFTPENIAHHFYHYSHGLKKHNGNCQRIAHGHRSTIEIHQDGLRKPSLEQQWCQQWQDIYIGTETDRKETIEIQGKSYHHFSYQAPQGQFDLTLPSEDCDIISTETTVELIAQHISQTLKQQYPSSTFTIRAYEGIGKGAIAYA